MAVSKKCLMLLTGYSMADAKEKIEEHLCLEHGMDKSCKMSKDMLNQKRDIFNKILKVCTKKVK